MDGCAQNVKRAAAYPRATEEMSAIIEAIADLIAKDYAYELEGERVLPGSQQTRIRSVKAPE